MRRYGYIGQKKFGSSLKRGSFIKKKIILEIEPIIERVENVKTKNIAFSRSGVIPYTKIKDRLYFCFGLDNKYKEYTDFGGGFKSYFDKSHWDTAIRELREESLNVFSIERSTDLKKSYVIHNGVMMILFQRFNTLDTEEYVAKFDQEKVISPYLEVESIEWMTIDDIKNKINDGRFYDKVANMITLFLEDLAKMLN